MPYVEALEQQRRAHAKVLADSSQACFLSVQHPPVITLGKNAKSTNILINPLEARKKGIDVVQTDRGGDVTMHMPGQLVIYPIIPLAHFRLGLRQYISLLENAVIELLAEFNLVAKCDPKYPGIWLGSNKVCALGVRVDRRVSLHGLALNVNNDLSLFDCIRPCGIVERGVTSITHELKVSLAIADIQARLVSILQQSLHATTDSTGSGRL
jgi:lipoyl(octanoyl) transferase